MSVTINQNIGAGHFGATTSGGGPVFTIPSTNHSLLLCGLSIATGHSGVSMVFDLGGLNTPMTLVKSQADSAGNEVLVFQLVNPPVITNTQVGFSWTGAVGGGIFTILYDGVDQTGGTTTCYGAVGATGTGTTTSDSLTINSGDIGFELAGTPQNLTSVNQTNRGVDTSGTVSIGASESGSGSINFQWTVSSSALWYDVAFGIKAFGAAPPAGSSVIGGLLGD